MPFQFSELVILVELKTQFLSWPDLCERLSLLVAGDDAVQQLGVETVFRKYPGQRFAAYHHVLDPLRPGRGDGFLSDHVGRRFGQIHCALPGDGGLVYKLLLWHKGSEKRGLLESAFLYLCASSLDRFGNGFFICHRCRIWPRRWKLHGYRAFRRWQIERC